MNKFAILILSAAFTTGAFAAAHTGGTSTPANSATMPEAQTSGSDKAKAAAEAKHLSKSHGSDTSAKQPEAQTAGSDKAKRRAEAKHKAKAHNSKKDPAHEERKARQAERS